MDSKGGRAKYNEAREEYVCVKNVENKLVNALAANGMTYKDGKVVFVRGTDRKGGEAVDNQGEVGYSIFFL